MLMIIFIPFASGNAVEIDDSAIFVEGFNAYQQKDYLLAIEKCDQLNHVFPDSPLRDVTLLLAARAGLKSGDNQLAAKSAALFSTEFPESSLKTSVEDELRALADRHQKGEFLPPNKTLRISANKVRSDRLAREKAAAQKLELDRLAKAKVESRIKLETERRKTDLLLAEKHAKASIKALITLHNELEPVPVGSGGKLPIEISNNGKSDEEFLLTVLAAKEYSAILTRIGKPNEKVDRLQLAAGETFDGAVSFRMPAEMIDGHRSVITVKAVSSKFSDIIFQKETVVLSSAPLVRAVAKLANKNVSPGEKLRYRVTLLNAGSLPAKNLTVRIQLPPEIDFQSTPDLSYKQEPDGTLVFKVDQVDTGRLAEINMDVKIRRDSRIGKQLLGQVEIVNGTLQRKDIFAASASMVVEKN